ncbi:hypothetical protein Nepgr_023850 [Nepenthes gracilis]|uniref:Uncharacterized protein n=1 Tax=Nepenthes gracilis TaxID=150966 RepID=A0AAD3T4N6_NEPGR|nr:hypothetical protein Nepgr_023850 [Nepenthes gracilis]
MKTATDPHPMATSVSPVLLQKSVEEGSIGQRKTQFTTPIDQFFAGAELGKIFLSMAVAALAVLLGHHDDKSEMLKAYFPIMIVLLDSGIITLVTSLLFQKSCPEYAALAAVVGTTCVVATLVIVTAILVPPQLEAVVWVFAALFSAVLAILCYTVYKKGILEMVHED